MVLLLQEQLLQLVLQDRITSELGLLAPDQVSTPVQRRDIRRRRRNAGTGSRRELGVRMLQKVR